MVQISTAEQATPEKSSTNLKRVLADLAVGFAFLFMGLGALLDSAIRKQT